METNQRLTGALWRKSSYSSDTGGECVEVAACPASVAVRDSKNPGGPVLAVPAAAFAAFVAAAVDGGFSSWSGARSVQEDEPLTPRGTKAAAPCRR